MGDRALRIGSIPTVLLAALLVWLPLQTPIAIVAFQYGGLSAEQARVILLLKDAAVLAMLAYFLARGWRALRLAWFDWVALGYAALVGLYSVVPLLLGSSLGPLAIAASAREFLVPVELYALGRAGYAAGADIRTVLGALVAIALLAAVFTTAAYVLLPADFWATTLDLVSFERLVQGLPSARTLWDISLLGHYGVGEGGVFARANGPFTHPVGTAHYFVLPAALAVSWALAHVRRWRTLEAVAAAVAAVCLTSALVVPISRGSWIAAGLAVLLVGFLYRRVGPALMALALTALFVALVPPFSYSISSALSGTDSSVIGHQEALEHGIQTAQDNPLGLGLGQADQFGDALSRGEGAEEATAAAVGENLYLALFVSVGPLGLLAYALWVAGITVALFPGRRPSADAWAHTAAFAALIGYAIAALTASSLMRFTTSATVWLIVGLLVADRLKARFARTPPGRA